MLWRHVLRNTHFLHIFAIKKKKNCGKHPSKTGSEIFGRRRADPFTPTWRCEVQSNYGTLIKFPLRLHINNPLSITSVNNALSVVSVVCPDEVITLAFRCHFQCSFCASQLFYFFRAACLDLCFSFRSDGADETQIAGCAELAGARGREKHCSLSRPLVLIEATLSHFQKSFGGTSHSAVHIHVYARRSQKLLLSSCVVSGETGANGCGEWRKCFYAFTTCEGKG